MNNYAFVVILILVVFIKGSLTETLKNNQKLDADRNKTKSVSPYLEIYREIIPSNVKEKINLTGRDNYRRNSDSRDDLGKKPLEKWKGKEAVREDFRDGNGLITKTGIDRTSGREENPSIVKTFGGKQQKRKPTAAGPSGAEERFDSEKHSVQDDLNGYLATTRHRKMKKHGSKGFINFSMSKERKPNIILILTDDQDVELGSLNFMPKTLRLLRNGGAEFRHAYVTTPMCCPSRSSLLTGMYVHNHHVFTNNENCSNIQWQQTHETRTFATYLSNAGYRTGYFGKYLNKYNGSYIPPGWREWGGLIMNSRYYNYSINLNGKKIRHGFDYYKDYYPDLIANDSVTFLRQSKQYFSRKPVMLVVSFPAPHGPEDSAPQYSKMFFNVTTHHTPSYDFAPNPDKQWILQVTNKMQDIHKQFTNVLMTKRLQTLQSVDSAVERIYQELKNIGELDNTYIIYTSDHGYHLGQFGLVKGKSFPFEFDVRVPFLIRGPGIEPATVVDDIVLNIDLAPTFLDIAGVESPLHMDGRSIVRLLHQKPGKRRKIKWPDTFLIESSGRREIPEIPELRKLKQEKLKRKQARLSKEKSSTSEPSETYNRTSDSVDKIEKLPRLKGEDSSEAESVDDGEGEISEEEDTVTSFGELEMHKSLDIQVDNKIPQIAQTVPQVIPKMTRLAKECQSPEMQYPCQPKQKWHCLVEGDRWRKYKCKVQKKCTCFTPSGFFYTGTYENSDGNPQITVDRVKEKGGKFIPMFRSRRSNNFDIWNNLTNNTDFTTLFSLIRRSHNVMRRKKRELYDDDHILDVLDDLEHELYEAEENETTINATFNFGAESNVTKCSVTSLGRVNCSNTVYSNFNVWKQSRDEIEYKIRKLKAELEALKEIRKHLREKRPEMLITLVSPVTIVSSTATTTSPLLARKNFENITRNTKINTSKENFGTTISHSLNPKVQTFTKLTMQIKKYTAKPTDDDESSFTSEMPDAIAGITTEALPVTQPEITGIHQPKLRNNENGVTNKIDNVVTVHRGRDRCICRSEEQELDKKKEEKEILKSAKRKLKEERLKKKERKLKKKAKLEKECLSEKMNCFLHDNDHWRTPPLWTDGPFCFCMNANNNTYSCLRTINATHNFLYCEFTTGFRTFYNLRIDPFEQLNRISALSPDESRFLSNQLADMKACKGAKECDTGSGREIQNHYYHHHHHHHHSYIQQHQPIQQRSDINTIKRDSPY